MTDLFSITITDEIACIDRELRLRKRVYPRWIDMGKLKQEKADREIEIMQAVLDRLCKISLAARDDNQST